MQLNLCDGEAGAMAAMAEAAQKESMIDACILCQMNEMKRLWKAQ